MLNNRWFIAAWLPFAVASCGAAAYLFLVVDVAHLGSRGPGGGGEGILFLLVWFLRLIALGAIATCYVLRPRGEAWNETAVMISTLLCGAFFIGGAVINRHADVVTIHVRAVDSLGQPLSGIRMNYRWSKSMPLMPYKNGYGAAISDADGIATFQVPTIHTLTVFGDKEMRPTHEVAVYDHGEPTLVVLHSKDGVSTPDTYRADPPKASELNLSIEFDPPTNR